MDFDSRHHDSDASNGWNDSEDRAIRLDPEAPDFHPLRFFATVYRTTRALLAQKELLSVGQALNELDEEVFSSTARIVAPDSPYLESVLPVTLTDHLNAEQQQELGTMHAYTAIQIGVHPDDPCLQWYQDPLFFPSPTALLEFELSFLEKAGKRLQSKGRLAAFKTLESYLGPISRLERRDFMSLSYAWVREMQAAGTEDERMLQALRLENLIRRAKVALDPRVELAALRQLSSIQGLTFQDVERGHRELIQLMTQPRQKRLANS